MSTHTITESQLQIVLAVLGDLRSSVDHQAVSRVDIMGVLDLVMNGLRRFVPAEPGAIIVEAPDIFNFDIELNEMVTSERCWPRSDSEHNHRGPQQKRRRTSD